MVFKSILHPFILPLIICLIVMLLYTPVEVAFITGTSMEPTLSEGDVVIATEHKQIEKGDIVSFQTHGMNVFHRVQEIKNNKILTKGDNLEKPDPVQHKKDINTVWLYKINTSQSNTPITTVITIFLLFLLFLIPFYLLTLPYTILYYIITN